MSTRWYPLYQKGNPQLRVFLPNFWMKMVKPTYKQPLNVVQFHCSMEMTKYDVKNYLEKIYNVKVLDVRTRIALGAFRRTVKGYIVKDDDVKVAYAILPRNETFEFPNVTEPVGKDTKAEALKKMMAQEKQQLANQLHERFNGPGVPEWFN